VTFILINTVRYVFNFAYALLFIRIILSWFAVGRSTNQLMGLLYFLTEPILAPIRSLLQRSPLGGPGMMIDFSPIIAFVLLQVVRELLIAVIVGFAGL